MSPAKVIEVKHTDGTLAFKCWEKDGLKLSFRVKDPDTRLKEIKELEYKDGDIFIATYPKVGKCYFVCLCEVLRPNQQLRPCRAGQLPVNTVPGQA